ncbi:MAG TPA: MobF family relaxase [Acidimicrobiales bacterium]|nr:MobF family relaxase [Acidimicrobiales bacterium]
MLIINSASADGVAYWQRSAARSTWLGQAADELGLSGAVSGSHLRDVLQGRRPGGEPITARPGLRRRHGWDLVFAAPKTVSLLALSGAPGAPAIVECFRAAVSDAVGLLEDAAAWVRRDGEDVRAQGVVAGAFEHLRSDAGQPHLHAHVVLANLGRPEGHSTWGCLVGARLWRWKDGLGPMFQLSLRHHLGAAGFGFQWSLGPGGLGEIAGIPLATRSAASSRSLASRAGALRFGSAAPGAARAAQYRARGERPKAGGGQDGLEKEEAAQLLSAAIAAPPGPQVPPSRRAVEIALAERSSTFSEPDVVAALGETCPSGLGRGEVTGLLREWCDGGPVLGAGARRAVPGPETAAYATERPRWTTPLADRLDREILGTAHGSRSARLAEVSPALASAQLTELGLDGQAAELGARLAASGEGISVIPRGPWLAQAAAVDAARAAWQAAGVGVKVLSPTEVSAARWRALTSLQRAPSGEWARPGRRVLVVDVADRLGPADLGRLVTEAASSRTKLVLVPGGTYPTRAAPAARALEQLLEELGPQSSGLGPAPSLVASTTSPPALNGEAVPGVMVRGAATGRDALAHLAATWQASALRPDLRTDPVGRLCMVALGPPEAEALNLVARAAWLDGLNSLPGPQVGRQALLGERSYAVGDLVLALHRVGPVPSAAMGVVAEVGSQTSPWVTVDWATPSPRRTTLGAAEAASLGYAYATTVPYLRAFVGVPAARCPGSSRSSAPDRPEGLWVLGDPMGLGAPAPLVRGAWVTLGGPGRLALGQTGELARHRAAVRELAVGWPSSEMLARAGPRPINAIARGRWEEAVARFALEQELTLGPLRVTRAPGPERRLVPAAPAPVRASPARSPRLGL